MTKLRLLLAATCLALGSGAIAQTSAGPVVDAPAGAVSGTQEGDIRVFKGLPYALPPIQGRRWRPPVAMPRWPGTRDATAFGPACIQPQSKAVSVYSGEKFATSEDCLTLNIWAPAHAKNAPVFFWIHGGALSGGSSREAMYDGRKLAERGVIVVSINYRLGVLGWLAHPGLSAESSQHLSGNYGLLDQIAALQWVRANVGAFGGDPARVTIAGESAGALSVMYLLESPLARGLFARAISESGYMVSMQELKHSVYGAPSGEAVGQMLSAGLQAPDVAALRGIDAQTLTDSAARLGFAPFGAVDGTVLPEQMVSAFEAGRQAHVPLLVGFNQGEIRSLMVLAPKPPATAAEYKATIRDRYGDLADAFLKLYPAATYKESIIATTRDMLYGWTAERMARNQTAAGQPAYLYLWDHGYPAADEAGLHAFHASELPYVFGTYDRTPPHWPRIPDNAAEHGLSEAMLDYWTSFAKGGAPVAGNAPAWPAYGTAEAFMHVTDTPHPETKPMPGMYAFNEAVVCRRRAAGKAGWNWNVGLASPRLPPKAAGCE
jgi:para-nitrobenzyl esterase